MLFCNVTAADPISRPATLPNTLDTRRIVLGGGFRLPVRTVDTGAIRLGGGFRLPLRGA